jgi:hypothetical protein
MSPFCASRLVTPADDLVKLPISIVAAFTFLHLFVGVPQSKALSDSGRMSAKTSATSREIETCGSFTTLIKSNVASSALERAFKEPLASIKILLPSTASSAKNFF